MHCRLWQAVVLKKVLKKIKVVNPAIDLKQGKVLSYRDRKEGLSNENRKSQ